ncbi:hypothetical protein L1085_008000 [Streptomyces sp. MSC1_001]
MRVRIQVERAEDGYVFRLTESQHHLLVNSLAALSESIGSPEELDLLLGPAGRGLEEVLSRAQHAETGSRRVVRATVGQAHAFHALLSVIPSLFGGEQTFHSRIGAYRENALAMAGGMLTAVRELPH